MSLRLFDTQSAGFRRAKMIQPPARRLGNSHGLEISSYVTSSRGMTSSIRNPAPRSSR